MPASANRHTDIAFFVPHLDGGGVERVVLNLTEAFIGAGYHVDIVMIKAYGKLVNQIPERANVVNLNAASWVFSIPLLARYLQQRNPRFLISGITSINLSAILANMLAQSQTHIVITEHLMVSFSIMEHPLKRLLPPLIRVFYPKADHVIAVSNGVAEDLSQIGHLSRKLITIIPNPVVTPELISQLTADVEHPWFQSNIPVFLGVGRLTQQKDFATLLRAFALVRNQIDARLIILGEGEARGELEHLINELNIADSVDMPGFVSNPVSYMHKASVFVLSSIYEGLGNVVIEAMLSQCAIVSTDCPSGPREILENGKHGHLIPIRDPESMAGAMLLALTSARDSAQALARAQDFSIDVISQQYLDVLFGDGNKNPLLAR